MPEDLSPHKYIATEVRAELARQKISQIKIAALLDISQVSVSRRLSGETPFDVNELAAIADLLRVPVAQFFPPERVA